MTRVRLIAMALGVAFAISAVAVTGASAELPEVGRCVNVAPATGKYKNGACTEGATATAHRYEWLPGPGPNPGFEAEAVDIHLERRSATVVEQVSCSPGFIYGHWIDTKTATIEVLWKGCINTTRHQRCGENNLDVTPISSDAEISTLRPFEGVLGFIHRGEKPTVGLELKAKSPETTLLTFACGLPPFKNLQEGPQGWTVEGAAIMEIKPVNVMANAIINAGEGQWLQHVTEEKYFLTVGAYGRQVPERLEGGETDTLRGTIVSSSGSAREEQLRLWTDGLEHFEQSVGQLRPFMPGGAEEPMEIKAR